MKETTRKGRRGFLKTVAFAGGAAQAQTGGSIAPEPAPTASTAKAGTAAAPGFQYPRKFTGRQLAMIAFPLGGVAAGSVSLGGRGQLRDWQIFNRPDKGRSPSYAFPSIWAQAGNTKDSVP